MNLTELNKLMMDAGINVCPVCHQPFEPYHSRQKTCGSDRCKREYKNKYLRELRQKQREEDLEAYRRYHREAQARYRKKKKKMEAQMERLDKMGEYWENYAERQVEKLLTGIEKIDTNMEKK